MAVNIRSSLKIDISDLGMQINQLTNSFTIFISPFN